MKMFNKINILQIVKDHIATLVNDNSKKPDLDDYLTFVLIPFAVASLLVYLCITLSDTSIDIIITTLSILVGLLFNVIVLIFDIIKRDQSQKVKNRFLQQLVTNITFCILICILSILSTLFTFIENNIVIVISSWIVYYLLTLFIFTVLMILKRTHKIFYNEFSAMVDE